MSYLPKAVVERGVKKRVRKDKLGRERIGYEAYFGTDPFTKFAVRITRASEDELRRDIKDFYLRHQAGGDAAVRLAPIEAIDAKAALDILRKPCRRDPAVGGVRRRGRPNQPRRRNGAHRQGQGLSAWEASEGVPHRRDRACVDEVV